MSDSQNQKQFEKWIKLKARLHYCNNLPTIHEGEIWWCSFGENVGIEINGKSERFTRPVLIVKRLGGRGFLGIPLTSQEKKGSWYHGFMFKDKKQFAALCQIRVLSAARLHDKLGRIPETDLMNVKAALRELYG